MIVDDRERLARSCSVDIVQRDLILGVSRAATLQRGRNREMRGNAGQLSRTLGVFLALEKNIYTKKSPVLFEDVRMSCRRHFRALCDVRLIEKNLFFTRIRGFSLGRPPLPRSPCGSDTTEACNSKISVSSYWRDGCIARKTTEPNGLWEGRENETIKPYRIETRSGTRRGLAERIIVPALNQVCTCIFFCYTECTLRDHALS